MLTKQPEYKFLQCDFSNQQHRQACLALIHEYMRDPMGGMIEPDPLHADRLVQGLSTHPGAFVVFIREGAVFAGLATCFLNFSTFRAKPYINIHDVVVKKEFRGKGLGRALLEYLIAYSRQQGYCKLTLEVREDNLPAQHLYASLGFEDAHPPMRFWTKQL